MDYKKKALEALKASLKYGPGVEKPKEVYSDSAAEYLLLNPEDKDEKTKELRKKALKRMEDMDPGIK